MNGDRGPNVPGIQLGAPMTSSLELDSSSRGRGGPMGRPPHHYPPPPYGAYQDRNSPREGVYPYQGRGPMDPHGLHSAHSMSNFTTGMPRAPSVGYMGDNIKKVFRPHDLSTHVSLHYSFLCL